MTNNNTKNEGKQSQKQIVNFVLDFLTNAFSKEQSLKEQKPSRDAIEWLYGNTIATTNASETLFHQALQKAITLLKKLEGLSLTAYKCQAGVWTIGYGNTSYLKNFATPMGQIITIENAEDLLKKDLEKFFNAVFVKLKDICTANQIAALTSFAFNVGLKAFSNSTLLKIVIKNPNDFGMVKSQFLRWININKNQYSAALFKRRMQEFELYCM